MPRFAVLAIATLLAACATTPSVRTETAPGASFTGLRSYSWLLKPAGSDPRIAQGIDQRLQAKGWKLVADGDLRVAARVTRAEKEDPSSLYGPGWGGFGPAVPGASAPRVDTDEVGSLVVEVFASASRRAQWRGSASSMLPDKQDRLPALVDDSLDRMFATFPRADVP